LFAAAYRAIASIPNSRLDPAAVRKSGSLINVLVAMSAALVQEVAARAFGKLSDLTYDGAKGSELDALVAERTRRQVVRIGAAPSRAVIAVSRPAGGALLVQTIEAGEVIGDVAGGSTVTFSLDYTLPFAAGQTGPIYTTATATAAGSTTNVEQGSIARFVSPTSFSDLTFVPSAVEVIAGGCDVETDDPFVQRAEEWEQKRARGTIAAIELGALTVPGIVQASVEEPTNAFGDPTGVVALYLADINGNCNSSLVAAVRLALRSWRCAGSVPVFYPSAPSYQGIVLHLGVLDGYSTSSVQQLARAAVVAAVNVLAPKATLQRSAIFAALRTVPGAVVGDDAVVSPALDVVPTNGATLRTRSDLVSFA
jgi:hypothetical protein